MEKIRVTTELLDNQAQTIQQLLGELERIADEVQAVGGKLRWNVAISDNICRALSVQSKSITALEQKAGLMKNALLSASSSYTATESRLCNRESGQGNQKNVDGGNSTTTSTESSKSWWEKLKDQAEDTLESIDVQLSKNIKNPTSEVLDRTSELPNSSGFGFGYGENFKPVVEKNGNIIDDSISWVSDTLEKLQDVPVISWFLGPLDDIKTFLDVYQGDELKADMETVSNLQEQSIEQWEKGEYAQAIGSYTLSTVDGLCAILNASIKVAYEALISEKTREVIRGTEYLESKSLDAISSGNYADAAKYELAAVGAGMLAISYESVHQVYSFYVSLLPVPEIKALDIVSQKTKEKAKSKVGDIIMKGLDWISEKIGNSL